MRNNSQLKFEASASIEEFHISSDKISLEPCKYLGKII